MKTFAQQLVRLATVLIVLSASNVIGGEPELVAPGGLTATFTSGGEVQLSWSHATAGQGFTIEAYNALYEASTGPLGEPEGAPYWQYANTWTSFSTSLTVPTGVSCGMVGFVVRAYVYENETAYYSSAATCIVDVLCPTPTILNPTVAPDGNGSLNISFDIDPGIQSYASYRPLTYVVEAQWSGYWWPITTGTFAPGNTIPVVFGSSYNETHPLRVRTYISLYDSYCSESPYAELTLATPPWLTIGEPYGNSVQLAWHDSWNGAFIVERSELSYGYYYGEFSPIAWVNSAGAVTTYVDTTDGIYAVYRVRPVVNGPTEPSNISAAVYFPLFAPTGLTATRPIGGPTNLSWTDNTARDEEVWIERRGEGGEFSYLGSVPTDATQYTDSSAPDDAIYFYRVTARRAFNGNEAFFSSSSDEAATVILMPPTPPENIWVSWVEPVPPAIAIGWNNIADNADYLLVERRLTVANEDPETANLNFASIACLDPWVSSFVDSTVEPGSSYLYRVRPYNEGGLSAAPFPAMGTVPALPPINVDVQAGAPGQLNISWQYPYPGPIAFYALLFQAPPGWTPGEMPNPLLEGWSTLTETWTDATSTSFGPNGSGYMAVMVQAYNPNDPNTPNMSYSGGAIGVGFLSMPIPTILSSEVQFNPETGAPRIQLMLDEAVVANSFNDTTWTWIQFSIQRNEDPAWQVSMRQDGTPVWQSGGPIAVLDDTVELEQQYTYSIRHQKWSDAGTLVQESEPVSLTIHTPLRAPETLTTVSAVPGHVQIAWTNPSATATQFRIERAEVYYGWNGETWFRSGTGEFTEIAVVSAPSTTFDDLTVGDGIDVAYRVQAVGEAPASAFSNETDALVELLAPTELHATRVAGSVSLSWQNPSVRAESFLIWRRVDGTGGQEFIGTAYTNQFDDPTIVEGVSYLYQVCAIRYVGEKSFVALSEEVPDTSAPVIVEVTQPGDVADSFVTLAATATDDGGEPNLTYTWSVLPGAPAAVDFDVNGDNNAKNTVARFTAAGSYVLRLTVRDLPGAETSADVPVTVLSVPTTLAIAPDTATLIAPATRQFSVQWSDQFGASCEGLPVTWATDGGTIDENGLYTAAVDIGDHYSVTAVAAEFAATAQVIVQVRPTVTLASPAQGEILTADDVLEVLNGGARFEILGEAHDDAGVAALTLTYWLDGVQTGPLTNTELSVIQNEGAIALEAFKTPGAHTLKLRVTDADGLSAESAEHIFTVDLSADTPFIVTPPAAEPLNDVTVALSVLGGDADGEEFLRYVWTVVSAPAGAPEPSFADNPNDSNEAKNTAATVFALGLYTFRVTIIDAQGLSVSATLNVAITLPAPSDIYRDEITVRWTDNAQTETGYVLERSVNSAAFQVLVTLDANAASHTDETLVEGTTVQYRVKAVRGTVSSTYATMAAFFVPYSIPVAPTGLTVAATTPASVELQWTDASSNETSFRIERATGPQGTDFGLLGTVNPNVQAYVDTTVAEGNYYTYRVLAVNPAGSSDPSEPVDVAIGLKAPEAFAISAVSDLQIDLAWVNVSALEFATLRIERETNGEMIVLVNDLYGSATVFNDTTVSAGTLYRYRAIAVDPTTGLESAPTPWVEATAEPMLVLTATRTAFGQIDLAWTTSFVEPSYFTLYRSEGEIYAWLDGAARTLSETQFEPGTTVRYRLVAFNINGSPYAEAISAEITIDPLNPPSYMSAWLNEGPPISVNLYWSDASDNEEGFVVERSNGSGYEVLTLVPAGTSEFTDYNVVRGAGYTYRVKAYNGTVSSGYAESSSVSIPPPLEAPTVSVWVYDDNIQLTIQGYGYMPPMGEFQIEFSCDNGQTFSYAGSQPNYSSPVIWYTYGRNYAGVLGGFRVRLVSGSDASPYSSVAAIPLPLETPYLTAGGVWIEEVPIFWSRAYNFPLTAYEVERSLDGAPFTLWATVVNDNFRDSPTLLQEGHSLAYRVRATNGVETTSYSNTVTFFWPNTVTITPAAPTVLNLSSTQFTAVLSDVYGQAVDPQPTFAWSVAGGGTINATSGLFTATTPGLPTTVTATALTMNGDLTGSTNVTIQSLPPTVTITSPTAGSSFQLPATITFTMIAQDPDGAIASVQLFNHVTSALLGTATRVGTTTSYKFTWTPTVPDTYIIVAKATNVENVVASSSGIYVSAISTPVFQSVTAVLLTPTSGELRASATDGSNPANLLYTWATKGTVPAGVTFNAANGVNGSKTMPVTFHKAGLYGFEVTVRNNQNQTATQSVNLSVNPVVSSITLSPNQRTIQKGQVTYFFASGKDQFQDAMTLPALQWSASGGSVSNGLFFATTAGTYTVQAASGNVTAQATVIVVDDPVSNNAAPIVLVPAQANPNPVDGDSTELSVLGDDDGGEQNLTYVWSLVSGPADVEFDRNESNTAKDTTVLFQQAGTYVISVAIIDAEGLVVASTETVVVNQVPAELIVTPGGAVINQDEEQQFDASVIDQFGNEIIPAPGISWAVSGGGTINGGLFDPEQSDEGGTFTVTASSNGLNGTARIEVRADLAPTIVLTAPRDGELFNENTAADGYVTFSGTVSNDDGPENVTVKIFVDDDEISSQSAETDGTFEIEVQLEEGQHTIRAQAWESDTLRADSDSRIIWVDTKKAENLTVTGPIEFNDVYGSRPLVWGTSSVDKPNVMTSPAWFSGTVEDPGDDPSGVISIELGSDQTGLQPGSVVSGNWKAQIKFAAPSGGVVQNVSRDDFRTEVKPGYRVKDAVANETMDTAEEYVFHLPLMIDPYDGIVPPSKIAVPIGSTILVGAAPKGAAWEYEQDNGGSYFELLSGYAICTSASGSSYTGNDKLHFYIPIYGDPAPAPMYDVLALTYESAGESNDLELELYDETYSLDAPIKLQNGASGVDAKAKVTVFEPIVDVYNSDGVKISDEDLKEKGLVIRKILKDTNGNGTPDFEDPTPSTGDTDLAKIVVGVIAQDIGDGTVVVQAGRSSDDSGNVTLWRETNGTLQQYSGQTIDVSELPVTIYLRGIHRAKAIGDHTVCVKVKPAGFDWSEESARYVRTVVESYGIGRRNNTTGEYVEVIPAQPNQQPGNDAALPGEWMDLRLNYRGPRIVTNNNIRWEISDDPWKDWEIDSFSTKEVKLPANELTQRSLGFYWLSAGQKTVKCTFRDLFGTELSATENFDIKSISASCLAQAASNLEITNNSLALPNWWVLAWGGVRPNTPGALWEVDNSDFEINVPQGFQSGTYEFLQIIKEDSLNRTETRRATLDTNGKWFLDHGTRYAGPFATGSPGRAEDSPSTALCLLTNTANRLVQINAVGEMHILFVAGSPDAHKVPLLVSKWHIFAETTFADDAWEPLQVARNITPLSGENTLLNVGPFLQSTTYPKWENFLQNIKWTRQ